MTDVFISYVREDERVVRFLVSILEMNGVSVWLDKSKLVPGQRWQAGIERAIRNGTFFLSIYSKAREERDRSYANEETVVAIEEIRKRPANRPYFIPVRLDDCEIDDRSIGGGESILSLQVCDLRDWANGLMALFEALEVPNPQIDLGVPLAKGLPSFVRIAGGHVTYDHMDNLPPAFQGMRFAVEAGWCTRTSDGRIMAYLETVAPFAQFQRLNKQFGLSGIHAVSENDSIALTPDDLTEFSFRRSITLPRGAQMYDLSTGQQVVLPFDLECDSDFVARGYVQELSFCGDFIAYLQPRELPRINMRGQFELKFDPRLRTLIPERR